MGLLNLKNADMSGGDYEPLSSGRYNATVFDVTMDTSGGDKTKGYPMFTVEFVFTDDNPEEAVNRHAWRRYIIPAAKHEAKAKAKMEGMIVSFFSALGYEEEEITSDKGFDPDWNDVKGRECVVQLGPPIPYKKRDGTDGVKNDVVTVRPAGTAAGVTAASSGTSLL